MTAAPRAATSSFAALAHAGDRSALLASEGTLTDRGLAARIEESEQRLVPARRLLLIGMRSHVDAVALYPAALRRRGSLRRLPQGRRALGRLQ